MSHLIHRSIAFLHARVALSIVVSVFLFANGGNAEEDRGTADGFHRGPLLEKMLAGPMKDVEEIIFAVRVPGRDHWYVTFGNYSCDYGPPAERAFWKDPEGGPLGICRRRQVMQAESPDGQADGPLG